MSGILRLIFREKLCTHGIARRPEPSSLMENSGSVAGFHAEGSPEGALVPLYHFSALVVSQLLPPGGTLMDLGSGSGQFLTHLARCRSDIRIIGLDLSEAMIQLGHQSLRSAGLEGRVSLRRGDMTRFSQTAPQSVHLVSSIFSLHHLPAMQDLERCMEEIFNVRSATGCAVWLFDHVRPRHPRTLEDFPEVFTPTSSPLFKQDSRNSLEASFSFEDVCRTGEKFFGGMRHELARLLPLYQVHWLQRENATKHEGHRQWVEPVLSPAARRDYSRFTRLFPGVMKGAL